MSVIKNISLFVPHVFPNFDETYIADVFAQFGEVNRVDLVEKQDRNGKLFNSAYIHFEWWNVRPETFDFQKKIIEKEEARVYHDGPWYWIVLENTAKKHVAGDRKPRIDLGDDKVINVNNVKTPEKPTLKRDEPILFCPNAPIKSYAQAVSPLANLSTSWSNVQSQFMEDIDAEMEDIEVPDLIDEEADEMLAQMDEIEAEIEAEDANLVSIDGRYVYEVERENLWLRNEVAQLRAALINLDYMYQAESAKVRALNVSFVNVIPDDEVRS